VPGPDEKPLTVLTPFNPKIVIDALVPDADEPIEVHMFAIDMTTFDPHVEPLDVPMQASRKYRIKTMERDGTVTAAFSGDNGHDARHYDRAEMFLGTDGMGTFTIHNGAALVITGTGTTNATEDRTVFKARDRDIRGVFTFPRDGQAGEVKLAHEGGHLIAQAQVA